jgi:hypothetical protein
LLDLTTPYRDTNCGVQTISETWSINYEPEEGGRVTGKLTVDDENVSFVALYDSSNATILKSIAGAVGGFAASGGHAVYLSDNDSELEFRLPKSEIASTATVKKMLTKRVIVTMNGGHKFTFNYGMLSVDDLAAAIGP